MYIHHSYYYLFLQLSLFILRFYLFIWERERTSSGEGEREKDRERERSRLPVSILGFVGHWSLLQQLNYAVYINQYVQESVTMSSKILFTKQLMVVLYYIASSYKYFFFFFQLQEAQEQHAEAVKCIEKLKDHVQKYNLKQHRK